MLRIYADFNASDENGNVCLNTVGSLQDIEPNAAAMEIGTIVRLYMTDEFEVSGTLIFEEGIWKAIPAWDTISHYE